jgi:hypothetical protein
MHEHGELIVRVHESCRRRRIAALGANPEIG